MKRFFSIFWALALLATTAQGQWYTKTYALKAGWNAIWLSGDASYGTMEEIFPVSSGVSEVWRWNPNPDKVLFTQSPSTATEQSDEWSIWKRGGSEAILKRMVGNSSYLIYCDTVTSLAIKQKSIPPEATWLRSGANFIGFPVKKGSATFSSYFARMLTGDPVQPRGLLTTAKIFSYVGGALGSSNPVRSLLTDSLEPDKPYWFDAQTVSDFYGPLSFETPFNKGIAFGRTSDSVSMGVTNRTNSSQKLTFTLESSEQPPTGQTPIVTPAPLLRTDSSGASASASSFSLVLADSGRATVEFGIDRTGMVDGKVYASTLVITDEAGQMEVRIPVTAQAATPGGLWQCEVAVSAVSSTTAAAARSTTKSNATAQTFPLSFLMHVDSAGKGRLLRQAFVGKLVASGNPLGITVIERLIQGAAVSDVKPLRFFAPIMPRRSPIVETTGSAISGAEMSWSLVHGYTDPSNPFVHAFHPDHDNMDAKFTTPLAEGVESYTVTRNCTFNFTSTPPDNSSIPGWGTTLLGGIYTEVMSGVNKTPITLGGMFIMRRISEISTIDTTLK
jgi:hypothetical protein